MSTQTQDSHNGWHDNGWPEGIGDGQVRGARFQRHDYGTTSGHGPVRPGRAPARMVPSAPEPGAAEGPRGALAL